MIHGCGHLTSGQLPSLTFRAGILFLVLMPTCILLLVYTNNLSSR